MVDFTTDQLKGRHVIDSRGRDLGKVEDVAIDPDMWRVRGLVIGLDREAAEELNMDSGRFSHSRLEISPERIQAMGDNVILNLDTDQLFGILRRERS